MITITRSLARHLRAVFRSAGFRQSSTRHDATLLFTASAAGLSVEGTAEPVSLRFCQPGEFSDERLLVPLACLAACEGKSQDPVTFESGGGDRVVARWAERQVPQAAEFTTIPLDRFVPCPPLPEARTTNPPQLLTALRDAAASTADTSTRYALDCIQIRGTSGQLVATDGRELLVQSGFDFGCQETLLIPGCGVFGCRELPQDAAVEVAHSGTHFMLCVGGWTIYLTVVQDKRYPVATDTIRPTRSASSNLHLDHADRSFLRDALPHLPTSALGNRSLTLDLNGQVIVRSIAEAPVQPTELVLTNSRITGEVLRIAMNQKYLERALQLGFEEIQFFGPEAPAQCDDGRRQFVWAVLHPNVPTPGAVAASRIESPPGNRAPQPRRRSSRFVPQPALTPPTREAEPSPAPSPGGDLPESPSESAGPIESAVALQTALREVLTRTKALVAALRRERKRTRLMRSTLTSLRQLESIAG